MTHKITIRNYQKNDEKEWVYTKALSYLFSDFFDDISQTKDTFNLPVFTDSIELVALSDNKVVGLIDIGIYTKAISQNYLYYPAESVAYFSNFAIHPDYQGLKIGQQLFDIAKEQLIQKNVDILAIFTRSDGPANYLYQKWGAELVAKNYLVVGLAKNEKEAIKLSVDTTKKQLIVTCPSGEETTHYKREGTYLVTQEEDLALFDAEKVISEYSYILRLSKIFF